MNRKSQAACFVSTLLLLGVVPAQGEDDWHYAVRINGWFPDVKGETAFHDQGFEINVEDVLSSVEMAFMGSFEARKGKWGVFTDLIYASVGDDADNLREGSIGPVREQGVETKISADLDVDNIVWNTAGFYRWHQSGDLALDFLAGFRYLDVEQELDWKINTSVEGRPLPEHRGSAEIGEDSWDVFVGVRGRVPLGESGKWFIPFYLDGGTGDSDFTWQAATGVGYTWDRWNVALAYRHLEYDQGSDAAIADLEMTGPAMVFEFNW